MANDTKTERIQLLMTPAEVEAVDDWSFANRVRGRSEAIRRLVAMGLEVSAAATKAEAKRPRRSGT